MINWTTEDYDRYVAETDDPRLVLVLERETDAHAPDGDAYPPSFWQDGQSVGSTFDDDDVTVAYFHAVRYFRSHDMAARYLRIFHDTETREVASTVDRLGDTVIVFDTPAWRDHCGIPATAGTDDLYLTQDWQAWLDGDVFGIGHAFLPDRVSHDQPFDVEELNIEMECWGFYGEDYAKDCAVEYAPTLNHPELRQPFLF